MAEGKMILIVQIKEQNVNWQLLKRQSENGGRGNSLLIRTVSFRSSFAKYIQKLFCCNFLCRVEFFQFMMCLELGQSEQEAYTQQKMLPNSMYLQSVNHGLKPNCNDCSLAVLK